MSSFNNNSYSNYLGARRCCDLRGAGPQGPIGHQGAPGPRGDTGFTAWVQLDPLVQKHLLLIIL